MVLILLLILIIILLVRRNKKKKKLAAEEAAEALARLEEERLLNEKQEILNMKNERSMTLRESVREFAEENPEIAATMIKTWLHGGENNGK